MWKTVKSRKEITYVSRVHTHTHILHFAEYIKYNQIRIFICAVTSLYPSRFYCVDAGVYSVLLATVLQFFIMLK